MGRLLDRLFQDLGTVSGRAAEALAAWADDPHVTAVNASNIPGPSAPMAVMDRPATESWTLAEIGDRHALRIALISLADELRFGLCRRARRPRRGGHAQAIASEQVALGA